MAWAICLQYVRRYTPAKLFEVYIYMHGFSGIAIECNKVDPQNLIGKNYIVESSVVLVPGY